MGSEMCIRDRDSRTEVEISVKHKNRINDKRVKAKDRKTTSRYAIRQESKMHIPDPEQKHTNQLRQQLTIDQKGNVDSKTRRVKNGNLKQKTAEPIVKAVRTSSRTFQNFEAPTCYKTRIGKNAIKTKRFGYMLSLIHI